MKVEVVQINNKDYYVLKKFDLEGNTYYFLNNTEEEKDLCFRKKIIENNEEYLVGLDNEEEFNKVMQYLGNMKD